MKKTDIAMIVLIASVSILVAFFVTKAIFGNASSANQKVQTIDRIDSSITDPDPAIFNKDAINPAVEVQVGTGSK
jgi:hypothetical protein